MGIPSANADEEVSKFLLEQAGFTNVSLSNTDPAMATDIRGNLGSYTYDIDAQTRTDPRGLLNLGIMNGVPNADRVAGMFRQDPNMTVRDLVLKLRKQAGNSYGMNRENKFLQSTSLDLNPSEWLDKNIENVNKDLIITSGRPGYRQTTKGLLDRHGPYDPELPTGGWGLLNLKGVRDNVLNMNERDLRNHGMTVTGKNYSSGSGALNLQISKRMLDQLTKESEVLDPNLIKALTR